MKEYMNTSQPLNGNCQLDQLIKDLPKEELDIMVHTVHRLGVLMAVKNTGSLDPLILAEWLFKEKGGILSVAAFQDIVENILPELLVDGSVDWIGELSPMSLIIVEDYERRLTGS